jgi:hypothetical protein
MRPTIKPQSTACRQRSYLNRLLDAKKFYQKSMPNYLHLNAGDKTPQQVQDFDIGGASNIGQLLAS